MSNDPKIGNLLYARWSGATSRPMRIHFTRPPLKISAPSNSLELPLTAGRCAHPQRRPDDKIGWFNLSQDIGIVYRDVLWTPLFEINGSTHCGWISLGNCYLY